MRVRRRGSGQRGRRRVALPGGPLRRHPDASVAEGEVSSKLGVPGDTPGVPREPADYRCNGPKYTSFQYLDAPARRTTHNMCMYMQHMTENTRRAHAGGRLDAGPRAPRAPADENDATMHGGPKPNTHTHTHALFRLSSSTCTLSHRLPLYAQWHISLAHLVDHTQTVLPPQARTALVLCVVARGASELSTGASSPRRRRRPLRHA